MKILFALIFACAGAIALVAAPNASAQTPICTTLENSGSVMISDATELDEAINCYNTATTPDDYTITLGADITYTAPANGATPISQDGPGYSLTINGDNNTLTGIAQVIRVTGAAPVAVTTIEIEATGDQATETPGAQAIDVATGATVTVDNSTVSAEEYGINNTEGTVTITNSTITVGYVGIANVGGTLTVIDSTVTTSVSASVFNTLGGIVTVADSTINARIYGIFNRATATLTNNTITASDNSAVGNFAGTMTVTNNTITTRNIGIYNNGVGTVTVENSSITVNAFGIQNQAGGTVTATNITITAAQGLGFYNLDGTMTVENSTIGALNLGVFNSSGTLNVTSSIVDSTTSCSGSSSVTIGADSFVTGTGCIGASTLSGTLGLLQDNGCDPSLETPTGCTLTRLLSADSNAVDAVACDAAVPVDQRGFVRPQGAGCDAGAVEINPCAVGDWVSLFAGVGAPSVAPDVAAQVEEYDLNQLEFDQDGQLGRGFLMHTFPLPDGYLIESAEFSTRVKAVDRSDGLYIGAGSDENNYAYWGTKLFNLGFNNGTNAGNFETLTFDLADLPTVDPVIDVPVSSDLTTPVNTNDWNAIHVVVGEDITVDYVRLELCVTVAPPLVFDQTAFEIAPEPSGIAAAFTTMAAAAFTPEPEPGPTCEGQPVTIDMNNGDPGQGTRGVDVILGTPGNDIINARGGDDIICAGDGDDLIRSGSGNDTVNAGDGNDTINSYTGNDTINAGPGDDIIRGGTGNDLINGNEGNDRALGGDGDDTINGNEGNDRLYGQANNDLINGGNGYDRLYGGTGNDTINGNNQNDLIVTGAGTDTINGGNGNDRCINQNTPPTTPTNCER